MSKRITMFATGIERVDGGIAAANKNVFAALVNVASKTGHDLDVCILHEPARRIRMIDSTSGAQVRERAYGGNKYAMAADITVSLFRSQLVVFDHVHLAAPLAAVKPFARRLRAKTAIFAHGSESWKRIKPVSVKAFQAANLTLANSNYTLRHMRETINGFDGLVCPLGLPPQFALTPTPPERRTERPLLTAADGSTRAIGDRAMLLVGRMDAQEREKGHRELISVLPRVREGIAAAELVFVGEGTDSETIAEAAAASPAASHIFFTGRVDNDALTRLYRAAYAYVMPSRQEGFGLVFLEAMNQALPCLACQDDGAADVVIDGETGLLVRQPIDEEELATSIVTLLSDSTRARSLGVAGWRRLNDQFTAAAHQERVEAALEPLLV